MKNTLRFFALLIVLTVTSCSKYDSNSTKVSVVIEHDRYYDTLTCNSTSFIIKDSSTKIVFENNIYKSTTTEG